MNIDTSPPRGMRDLLPAEVDVRDAAMSRIVSVYRKYGFQRVETPALESLNLLVGGGGGENEKLIFKVLKRGEKLSHSAAAPPEALADLGLRFDLTVPLARYYAHNHARLPHPLRAIQIGPVWRAERPQRGRYRQFTQCDIDILGVDSEIAEVELILATTEALHALGLVDLTVRLNDRRLLVAIAERCGFAPERFESVFISLDKLDKVGPPGVRAELEAAGHPTEAVGALIALLADPAVATGQVDDVLHALAIDRESPAARGLSLVVRAVREASAGRCALVVDPTLVRGMSYYTGQIFEIAYKDFPSSIAGGGRYDRMIGRLLGRDVPACGFSIGFERIVAILQERATPAAATPRLALIANTGTDDMIQVVAAAQRLRAQGYLVSIEARAKRLRKQLDDLAAHGVGSYLMVGDTDIRPIGASVDAP